MKTFDVDDDLVTLIWERAQPAPPASPELFLTFNQALRRVLATPAPTRSVLYQTNPRPSAEEVRTELKKLDEEHLELLSKEIKDTRSLRAASPSAEKWAVLIPELCKSTNLRTWKDICDHFAIEVEGDSGRRKLRNWVKKNHPEWPPVPDVNA